MRIMNFKYFRDPDNFAFKTDEPMKCSVCGMLGVWFDAGGFYGIDEIECICDECLAAGKLKALEIEANEAFGGSAEENDEIIFATPALPTWQDRVWPYVDGSFCVFERIASKQDFDSKEEFKRAFSNKVAEQSDLEWLWQTLPEKTVENYQQGGDVTVYLFSNNGAKYCTWDAN
ncbi:hypothetical protein EZV61_18660 [Corallincola luteus]|uniref:CbrC family protein n=1 Tax=Corallincola luteus TaxID=1775177 RepID=A0ABY2AGQ4_9GAMM|nr:hypothetical protein EZV61_18660 [Corallincola luteus]